MGQDTRPTTTAAAVAVLPRSFRLVVWGNAVLHAGVSLDDAATAVVGRDVQHRVEDQDGSDLGLTVALGRWRSGGATGLRLVLPVPGDPSGLCGPGAVVEEAVAAGEATLVDGPVPFAALPALDPRGSRGAAVRWRRLAVGPVPPPTSSLADAERGLRAAVRQATELLTTLDLARRDEEAMAAVQRVRDGSGTLLPSCYPARAHRVLAQAELVVAVARLAARTEGAAATAGEVARRSAALLPLHAAGRRAVVAAAGVLLEPTR